MFLEGKKHGEGIKVFSNGNRIEGVWKDNKFKEGKFIQQGGSTYSGQWLGGRAHGKGKKEWPDGRAYDGMFRFGKPWGAGTKIYPDGLRRHGYWNNEDFIEKEALL